MSTGTPSPAIANARARIASLSRSRRPDDPDLINARRDLSAAKLEQYFARITAAAPPLTTAQKARLAALIGGGAA